MQNNPQVFIPKNYAYKQIKKTITSETPGSKMYSRDYPQLIQITYTGKKMLTQLNPY